MNTAALLVRGNAMFRVEMRMSRRGTLAMVLDWFAHCDKAGQWFVTVSAIGDRIFSLPVDVKAEEITRPAIVVARLWPQLLTEGVNFDFGGEQPTHLQAEIRRFTGPGYWPQSSGWLWQDGRVVVYRSYPVIYTDSKQLNIASQELLAGECFAYAAELEADWLPELSSSMAIHHGSRPRRNAPGNQGFLNRGRKRK